MDLQKIGEAIRLKRAKLGYSQTKTAELANLSSNFYSAIERGEKNGSLETFYNIAVALEMSLDTMLADVYDPASEPYVSSLISELRSLKPDHRRLVLAFIYSIKDFPDLKVYGKESGTSSVGKR